MDLTSGVSRDQHILPCLSGLESKELALLEQKAKMKRFKKNSVIFSESTPVNFFFIVKSGAVKLFKTSREGRELTIRTLCQNDCFCCSSFFTGEGHLVNAVSTENSTLVIIPVEEFKKMLSSTVGEIGTRIITCLCARVRRLSSLVEDLTFKDVEQRIIMVLLRLAEKKSPESNRVTLAVTHLEIASMAGTVREVVSRAMSQLKRDGVIMETNVKRFKVDKDMLMNLLDKRSPAVGS